MLEIAITSWGRIAHSEFQNNSFFSLDVAYTFNFNFSKAMYSTKILMRSF